MHINFTVFIYTVRMVCELLYKDFIVLYNNFSAILFYMSQKCHNDLFMTTNFSSFFL